MRTFAPHCFQRATRVAHAVFSKAAADKIRDATGQAFCDRVFALRTIATDEIGAPRDFGQ